MERKRLMVRTEDVVNGNLWRMYPAVNCDHVADVPSDYPGPIGVPITFMDKYDPNQFEILGLLSHGSVGPERSDLYKRILIRHLHPELPEEIDLVESFGSVGVSVDVEYIAPSERSVGMVAIYRHCRSSHPALVDGRRFAKEAT